MQQYCIQFHDRIKEPNLNNQIHHAIIEEPDIVTSHDVSIRVKYKEEEGKGADTMVC